MNSFINYLSSLFAFSCHNRTLSFDFNVYFFGFQFFHPAFPQLRVNSIVFPWRSFYSENTKKERAPQSSLVSSQKESRSIKNSRCAVFSVERNRKQKKQSEAARLLIVFVWQTKSRQANWRRCHTGTVRCASCKCPKTHGPALPAASCRAVFR